MINKNEISGLLVSVVVAAAAFLLAEVAQLGNLEMFALLIGFLLANIISLPDSFSPGIKFAEKRVLGWAIALMGLQLNFSKLDISWWLMPVIVLAIFVALNLGSRISKRFGVLNTCGYMIGVGTGVCGASAIAAVSPLLNTRAHETGVAVGVVNVLGTVGMLLLPLAAMALGLSPDEAGVFIGGSLQAVGQVVGAGYAMGDVTGEVATLVKLGRVLMLGPVVIYTALVMQSKTTKFDRKKVLPGFIIAFLIFLLITNLVAIPADFLHYSKWFGKGLLTIAMAAIGMQIKLRDLLHQGPKALLLGGVIFAVQISLMLAYIYVQRFFG